MTNAITLIAVKETALIDEIMAMTESNELLWVQSGTTSYTAQKIQQTPCNVPPKMSHLWVLNLSQMSQGTTYISILDVVKDNNLLISLNSNTYSDIATLYSMAQSQLVVSNVDAAIAAVTAIPTVFTPFIVTYDIGSGGAKLNGLVGVTGPFYNTGTGGVNLNGLAGVTGPYYNIGSGGAIADGTYTQPIVPGSHIFQTVFPNAIVSSDGWFGDISSFAKSVVDHDDSTYIEMPGNAPGLQVSFPPPTIPCVLFDSMEVHIAYKWTGITSPTTFISASYSISPSFSNVGIGIIDPVETMEFFDTYFMFDHTFSPQITQDILNTLVLTMTVGLPDFKMSALEMKLGGFIAS